MHEPSSTTSPLKQDLVAQEAREYCRKTIQHIQKQAQSMKKREGLTQYAGGGRVKVSRFLASV